MYMYILRTKYVSRNALLTAYSIGTQVSIRNLVHELDCK